MVDVGDDSNDLEDVERIARQSETIQNQWLRTLEDMQAMTEDREDRGYEVLQIPAGDTTPKPPESGETDRFGFSYVIPGNLADRFRDLYEDGDFSDTAVYQQSDGGHVYVVTECVDAAGGSVVFVAGAYQMRHAPALVRAANERGEMYSHVRTLDGTHLGSFKHDDVSAFFPNPEEFLAYDRADP